LCCWPITLHQRTLYDLDPYPLALRHLDLYHQGFWPDKAFFLDHVLMTLITSQCVVPHSVRDVYDTIVRVGEYPHFLPGCDFVHLVQQEDDFLVADTSVSGFVFRTRMHWSETDGGMDVFFDNAFVHGAWHVMGCIPQVFSRSDGVAQNSCVSRHQTHIQLRITISAGLFYPILRIGLSAMLPRLQRAFQKRLDDLQRNCK